MCHSYLTDKDTGTLRTGVTCPYLTYNHTVDGYKQSLRIPRANDYRDAMMLPLENLDVGYRVGAYGSLGCTA